MTREISVFESPPDSAEAGPVAGLLLDGEGTLFPPGFPQLVLLPYARRNLRRFLDAHRHEPALAEALAELGAIAPGAPPVETLEALMDRDARLAPLRTVQVMLWEHGFARGDLRTPLDHDIALLLRRWRAAGLSLFACATCAEAVQRLLLRHSAEGDLASLFGGFFDTRAGVAQDRSSFAAIRDAIEAAGRILFISSVEARLEAAARAGFAICRLPDEPVHEPEGAAAAGRHRGAAGLRGAASLAGLPS